MLPSHLLTPQLLLAVNEARRAMGKRAVTEFPSIDWKGFLTNALGLRPMEFVSCGELVLFSPVDAEHLEALWGTTMERKGEYHWHVVIPTHLMAVENAIAEAIDSVRLPTIVSATDHLKTRLSESEAA